MGREVKNRLLIDVDSTVWAAEAAYNKCSIELFGVPFGDDWYDVAELIRKYGEGYVEIFRRAIGPDSVEGRVPYPGFVYAMERLDARGYALHFLSHNHDPEAMQMPVHNWLVSILPFVPFELEITLSSECKAERALELGDVALLIDDKPETIVKAYELGVGVATKLHPWNRELVEQGYAFGFNDWGKDVAKIEALISESALV